MLKKFIFSVGVLTLGITGIITPNPLSATTMQQVQLSEISQVEKLLVCCDLADKRIMDLNTALNMLRDGRLTITKIGTGIYQVVYPGGLLIVSLETGNL